MKKTLLSLLICLFSFISCFSQNVYVEFAGGVNFPLTPYSNQGLEEGDGNARIGPHGNLTVGYRFSDKFSVGLKGIFINNKQGPETGRFVNPGPFVTTVSWSVNSLFLDVEFSKEITEKIFFELQANTGLVSARFPNASINANGFVISLDEDRGSGIGAGGGVGFRFYTSENLSLKTNLFFMTANPKIETFQNNTDIKISQNINVLLLNFGVNLDIE
ncbi:MAG: hypothetical protein AAF696_22970 [Bacteroidota bacterium]